MTKPLETAVSATAPDYDSTLVTVAELSGKSWLVGSQVPGVARRSKHSLKPRWEDPVALLDRLRRRAEGPASGRTGWSWPTRRAGTGFGWRGGWPSAGSRSR